MEEPSVCIFCRNKGPFTTIEHIIPEALGNDKETISGLVCDKCQNYLGREVEKAVLEKTNFAFWRAYLGISNKKGKLASVNLTPIEKGKIPAYHQATDKIGYTAHQDGSTSVDIDDSRIIQDILHNRKSNFKLVLSPWHISIIGRFLGKIGLELLASINYELAITSAFDELRNFVRFGSVNELWPIFWGSYGNLKDLKGPFIKKFDGIEQEINCYSYSLGISVNNEYCFAFLIGTDLLMINLSNRQPNPEFLKYLEVDHVNCVWYPDDSWGDKLKNIINEDKG